MRVGAALFFSATLSVLKAQCFLVPTQLARFTTKAVGSSGCRYREVETRRTTTMATGTADVCRTHMPTPGWLRLAQRNLAQIKPGDALPDAVVRRLDEDGNVEKISVRRLFGKKKGVLVGVPGAFTPTCSTEHLPDFVKKADVLEAKGAELVCFFAVNDVYVMQAWEESQKSQGKVLMLSDGNGDLSAEMGLLVDLTAQGMGYRCKRFMCVVEGGVVTHTTVGNRVDLVSAAAAEGALSEEKGKGAHEKRGGLLFEKLLGREMAARAAKAEQDTSESEDLLPA